MKNKTKTKKNQAKAQSNGQQKKTPFSDAGAIVGSRLGSMFNAPYLKGVGKWLGQGIGSIFGSGDYTLAGPKPQYNVLTNGAQIPQFHSNDRTNIICHREFIGDIKGTTAFTNRTYALNPGNTKLFPWLSSIAGNYQEYRFHGLIFEFRPLITDFASSGSPGVVVFATNYNADAPPFVSKYDMENSEFAVSTKPTTALLHGIECDMSQTPISKLYVRTGNVPTGQDLRLYDLGLAQFASLGNTDNLLLGELWVSYCVEFFKPILPKEIGSGVKSSYSSRTSISSSNPLGLIGITQSGDLDSFSVSATNVSWIAEPGQEYFVNVVWYGDTTVTCAHPAFAITSLDGAFFPLMFGDTRTVVPENGTVTRRMSQTTTVVNNGNAIQLMSLTYDAIGVLPLNSTVAVFVTEIDNRF